MTGQNKRSPTSFLTKHFAILHPQNSSINELDVARKRQSLGSKALKSRFVRSGLKFALGIMIDIDLIATMSARKHRGS